MDNLPADNNSNFIFYQGNNGKVNIQVVVDDNKETIWVTQKSMSEIFGVKVPAISKHLSNIFEEGELQEKQVISKMEITASDGKKYITNFYNLDAIISVGYRVNSQKATQFRIWATSVLKEYMIKGFTLDDDRLKQGTALFGKDYFDELLERIREIRSSERRFYQKITDIYAQCSIDYDPKSKITKDFYATVQNKLHFSIHHNTAAELINKRADSKKPNMGLTTFKNAGKNGKVLKSDVSVAKNYLTEEEINELNRLVSMYLDFAENMAKRRKEMKMSDWIIRLDDFLRFNEYEILENSGSIQSKVAKKNAEIEYEKFRIIQDIEYKSDFDKIVEEIKISGKIPKRKPLSIKEHMDENLSNFDKSLKKGLEYNPKED